MLPSVNPQETDALLERFGAEPRHLLQLFAALETPVLFAEFNNVLRRSRVNAGHVGQERRGSGIHVHTDVVYSRFHDVLQAFVKMLLGDVMLVLPNTNRLRLNLDQLCQRIL
ncbi:hypothetical protein D3C81_1505250 [compost metagenome]